MPMHPPRICGCGKIVAYGVLCTCQLEKQAARKARHEAQRPSARERGYDSKWSKARAEFLARPENRMCSCGCGRIATIVHHKTPHKGDMKLFWRRSNWEPTCQPCHDGPLQSQERKGQQ